MTELYSLIGATKPERLPQIRGSEQVEEMTLEQVSVKDKLSDREEHNHTESHQKSNSFEVCSIYPVGAGERATQ